MGNIFSKLNVKPFYVLSSSNVLIWCFSFPYEAVDWMSLGFVLVKTNKLVSYYGFIMEQIIKLLEE